MYNSITEEKIKQVPQIKDIDTERLPQELTRIYAQIIALKHHFEADTINLQTNDLYTSVKTLLTLANNLETILITSPNHEKKESIAFVAGVAHSLIHKIGMSLDDESYEILEIDTISTFISGTLLFLIGNSQADAAEIAGQLNNRGRISNRTKGKLIFYIQALAEGKLLKILKNPFNEKDEESADFQELALNSLWRELGFGIYTIANKLVGNIITEENDNYFDRVIDLSVSENIYEKQKSIFTGPYHLAKLLKILEADILNRAVINTSTPKGVDYMKWKNFLGELAFTRPYLWENHKAAVDTNLLEPGISAILTLPTGAGKSTLSELKIASCLFSGRKVIYIVPTHALEDQVNRNLKKLFDEFAIENIEFDGEFTEFVDIDSFPILVMTPERCLTLINMSPRFFQFVGLVVFDEFHLIHGTNINKDRRAIDAMSCLITLFTMIPQADYLLTSAMVENGIEIAEWVSTVTNRECKLFNSSWKPTRQLHGCLIFEETEILALNNLIREENRVKTTKNPPTHLKKRMNISPSCFFSLKNIWETVEDSDYYRIKIIEESVLLGINNYWGLTTNRNDIAARLGIHFSSLGLKTLIFVDNPKIAISTSEKISKGLIDRPNSYEDYIKKKKNIIASLTTELGLIDYSYFHSHTNVGIHHGLLLPIERSLIEQYFKDSNGSIALVATATLAQGINLPAEIVIIAGDDRYNEDSKNREQIPPHELLNAAGRAGRAGQSSQGAVILIPGEIVTIKDSTISNRWWTLKNEVFSKSDQCLKIEDPLEYFLDSIQNEAEPLNVDQINILYRFKAENLSESQTKKMLNNSFYAFRSAKENKNESFIAQVDALIKRRNELDALTEQIVWIKEISFKTGIDPSLILELSDAIDLEDFDEYINLSVIQFIDWFFNWLQDGNNRINRIFTKQSTINQIKKAIGLDSEVEDMNEISKQLPLLKQILILYVQGVPLSNINDLIPGNGDLYLTKARNFVIRLIPDISFSFGLLSMIIIERAKQNEIEDEDLSWTIRALSSCIKEGFDDVDKLFYKKNNIVSLRVETHIKYNLEEN